MSILKARSPYIVYESEANLNSFLLELYIYTGTRTTDRPASPNYTFVSTAYNEEAYVDISEFVRDYIETEFDGSYSCEAVNVDYQVTRTVNDVIQSADAIVNLDGFDGLSWFEEDQNAQFDSPVLIPNRIVLKPHGATARIPLYQEDATAITYFKDNCPVHTEDVSSTSESTDFIRYIQDTVSPADDFINRAKNDSGIIEANRQAHSFLCNYDIYGIDRILVETSGEPVEIKVKTVPPANHDFFKVTFINRDGAKQDIWFFGNSQFSTKVKFDGYKSNLLINGSKVTSRHQYRKIGVNSRRSIRLNSGFVPEALNSAFEEMLNSELAWITIDNQVLPLDIDTQSFEFKTHLANGLIEYQINAKFGFDRNNTVR